MHYQTKIQIKDAICNIGRFLYNLLYFADHSPRHNDYATLRKHVLLLTREEKERYAEECAYIATIPIDKIQTIPFPYPNASGNGEATGIEVHREKGLPYVIHGKKGKLVFPEVPQLHKLSCCVYHRQDDAYVIDSILKGMGYTTRFSEGYMLPIMNGIRYQYFRHGVIYAQKY